MRSPTRSEGSQGPGPGEATSPGGDRSRPALASPHEQGDPKGASPGPERPRRGSVAIALLWRDGLVLVRRRRADEWLPGVWEFPGGKVDPGETPEEAAAREVMEEMEVEATGLRLIETIEFDYPDRAARIFVFEGSCRGEPHTPDGAAWEWISMTDLSARPIPPANRDLVGRLAASPPRG